MSRDINSFFFISFSNFLQDHDYWTGNNQILSQDPSKAGTVGQILSQDPSTSKAEEVFPKENIENSVPNTTISSVKPKRRRMATKRLTETLKASENMQTIIKDENATKGAHRNKKICLLERDVTAKERIAEALEKLVEKFC